VGGGDAGDLEDGVAFAGGGEAGRIALLGGEGLGDDLRAVGQAGDDALFLSGGVVTTSDDGLRRSWRGRSWRLRWPATARRRIRPAASFWRISVDLDGGLHFAEGLGVRGLALLNLDDVIAELGVDDLHVADLLGEDGGVELGNHGAATGKAEFAALCAAAGIFGVLLGEIGEVGSALDLLEEPSALALASASVLAAPPGRLDEDVARAGLLGNLVFGLMRGVVGLNLLRRRPWERRRESGRR
jgi:hypothetical protein